MCKNIAVFFGGVSGENEISVITGTMVCNVLKRCGKCVLPVYITQGGDFLCGEKLSNIKNFAGGVPSGSRVAFIKGGIAVLAGRAGKRIKRVFPVGCAVNCCHGGWGEGGGISGLCAAMSVPLASAGVFESSAFMDKYLTKIVLKGLGIDTLECEYLMDIAGATRINNFPVMVKPASLGSSIGVVRADNRSELESALEVVFRLDTAAVVERYIARRREINCAAYACGGRVVTSPCEEVFGGEILSYDDKYSGSGRRVFPAQLTPAEEERIRGMTAEVCERLGVRGIVRFDYIIEGENIRLCEVNTVPGSLSHYLLAKNLEEFGTLLVRLIDDAVLAFENDRSKLLVNTGIINNFASNACKLK